MPMPRAVLATALAALLSAGCERSPQPAGGSPAEPAPAAPAAPPAAAPAASPAAPGAAAPAPAEAPSPAQPAAAPGPAGAFTVLRDPVALEPGGATLPLALEAETVVDPGAHFRLDLTVASADARLVLLDPNDAAVAAAGTHDVGATTRLTLSPSEPLRPGSRYTLRLDGATTREFHDAAGKAYAPAGLTVLIAGTPPPPEPKPQPAKRKRRAR
ncbi:Ig-like domain-containing protein [Anaeromyxobacter dehalogenans]|uniref:Ig-like domain-containing protein n=1 Tax=Anaeromyxobacter dehalogenans TaxID=161493 RepID=UPI00059C332C|nr:Ig-like domain-containing protein [Anaeromyxobacter dehalogenans]